MDDESARLQKIEKEIKDVTNRIYQLQEQKIFLKDERNTIIAKRVEEKRVIEESLEPDWTSSIGYPWSSHLQTVARENFKFGKLRSGQLEVMNAHLSCYDVFSVMKTGGGKSLCYQLPALASQRGFTLVIR
jgi:hypothetical protein